MPSAAILELAEAICFAILKWSQHGHLQLVLVLVGILRRRMQTLVVNRIKARLVPCTSVSIVLLQLVQYTLYSTITIQNYGNALITCPPMLLVLYHTIPMSIQYFTTQRTLMTCPPVFPVLPNYWKMPPALLLISHTFLHL